jgi:hypothetical protein
MPLDPPTRAAHATPVPAATEPDPQPAPATAERGGPAGPEPTRFGDWERKGRCVDF